MKSRRMPLHGISALLLLVALLPACNRLRDVARKLDAKSDEQLTAQAHSPVTQVDGSNFDSFSRQRQKVVVVDFYADWCGPCRALGPILETIATESKGMILLGKVNIDKNSDLAGLHGVRGIPDVRIFRDGKEVDRFVGAPTDVEVRRRIEVHTQGLPPPKAAAVIEKNQPSITPATKDWLPPGVQRR